MGLSDPQKIWDWLESKGGDRDGVGGHAWEFLGSDGLGDDAAVRAACRACGLIRRKPLSSNAEIYIDLSGPCPGDSAYWREQQEERLRARSPR